MLLHQIAALMSARLFLLLVVPLALLLIACKQKWFLTVSDGGQSLCFSEKYHCDGGGVQLDVVEITEMSSNGERERVVWLIQVRSEVSSDHIVKKLEYGKVPHGWIEIVRAEKLKPDITYSVLGEYYFSLNSEGKSRLLPREEYFQRIDRR
jgi:hypothetical protein